MSPRKKIAIIGVGLIGGSLALRLHEKKLASAIVGVDENINHQKAALDLELIDEVVSLDQALAHADVFILSTPVSASIQLLPYILDHLRNDQMVLDVGSTKAELMNVVAHHPNRARFIGTHPMWGTEHSGPQAASKESFMGKVVVLCDVEESAADVLKWTEHMYQKIGMKVMKMLATKHDVHTAYISHISHISSFALANTVLMKEKKAKTIFALASSGFESSVRLAKSNPQMWEPILLQNKENVLDVLTEHITQLQRFKKALEENSSKKLYALMEEANQIKKILK